MLLQPVDQLAQVGHVLGDARLHQRLDGGHEQVQRGLFRAAQAGAVAAGEGEVVALVEQDRLQGADALLEVVDADVLLRRGGQVEPEVPLVSQLIDRFVGLGGMHQGLVVADLHALHAALAGVAG